MQTEYKTFLQSSHWQYLIVALAGFSPAQPDLVLSELTSDVRNHLPHVQPLTSSVVSPVNRVTEKIKHMFKK